MAISPLLATRTLVIGGTSVPILPVRASVRSAHGRTGTLSARCRRPLRLGLPGPLLLGHSGLRGRDGHRLVRRLVRAPDRPLVESRPLARPGRRQAARHGSAHHAGWPGFPGLDGGSDHLARIPHVRLSSRSTRTWSRHGGTRPRQAENGDTGPRRRARRPRCRPAVLHLSRHALQRPAEQVGNPLWTTPDELESELSDWDDDPAETLLVEEQDGEVIGFGGVEVSRGWEHADLFGPLVAPEYRGQNRGTVLLEASIERAEDRGAQRVLAAVGARNLTGRLLLERAGFRHRGTASAIFRLSQADHRPAGPGPSGVAFRRGRPGDLEAALRLYRECFPGGVFPESAWRAG